MPTILVINGPNLNRLGVRDKHHYGIKTLHEIHEMMQVRARELDREIELLFFQSNHEGALIDFIQEHADARGLIINPGALAHYSHALSDALRDFSGGKVEVHLSDIANRESFRKESLTALACDHMIFGKKELGYIEALEWMCRRVNTN